MDNLYKTWLNQEQQVVMDTATTRFWHDSVLPECLRISLMCDDVLERMFLFPEEIEEIEIGQG